MLIISDLEYSYFKYYLAYLSWEIHSSTCVRDSYGNEKNTYKELFLLINNKIIYNIVGPGKPNIFFSYTS